MTKEASRLGSNTSLILWLRPWLVYMTALNLSLLVSLIYYYNLSLRLPQT